MRLQDFIGSCLVGEKSYSSVTSCNACAIASIRTRRIEILCGADQFTTFSALEVA